jgi:hypothetical protein
VINCNSNFIANANIIKDRGVIMHLSEITIEDMRAFKDKKSFRLNSGLNIIVGEN